MVVCSSTHARYLHLSMAIFSTPTSTDFLTPLETFICRDLMMAYIFSLCDSYLISVDLSLDTSVFSSPKPLSINPNLFPKGFLSLIKFSSLGMSLILHFHAFHFLKPKFLGFLQNLGFFKIKGVIFETLGWFLFK